MKDQNSFEMVSCGKPKNKQMIMSSSDKKGSRVKDGEKMGNTDA